MIRKQERKTMKRNKRMKIESKEEEDLEAKKKRPPINKEAKRDNGAEVEAEHRRIATKPA